MAKKIRLAASQVAPETGALRTEPAALVKAKPRIQSFDVFDTLIARRCIRAAAIFDIVEARSGLVGFAAQRVRAEAAVAHRPYQLEDIYIALAQQGGHSLELTRSLFQMEIAVERENVIPIAENMAAVREGDMLVSDMYLGHERIRTLLADAGFDKSVSLVVSSDGKSSGRIWPKLLAVAEVAVHVGDNLHSDVAVPARFGISSRHTRVSDPTRVEATLLDIGLKDLAVLARTVRLGAWSADSQIQELNVAEANYNLPVLILSSVLLLRHAERIGVKKILFSSRDCNLWLGICRAIAATHGISIGLEYFFTSRLTRRNPSPDYLAYASHLIDEKSMVVDLCGTGWSLAHLLATIGRRNQPIAFLHQLPRRADYETLGPTPETAQPVQLLAGVDGCNNTAIEMCNYASHGMVVDVCEVEGSFAPFFAPDPRSDRTHEAIRAQQRIARAAIRLLQADRLRETAGFEDVILAQTGGALYRSLAGNLSVYRCFLDEHNSEDAAVRRELGCA